MTLETLRGKTEPRLWTKPLRELTPETSLGFEVIEFARIILGIELYPWQRWLLIHALELLEDGRYRFRRVIVLCARQQGKTTLASVLGAWWLFVDSARHPDRVPPVKFKVVGVAQNLDIAREPWAAVKMWCDPKPDTAEEAELAIEALQDASAKVVDAHGKESIVARSRAHYEIRAARNARGKPAARILMDELREQKTWEAWNAVSQTTKSFFNGQLWGISSAGDVTAVVLRAQRDAALKAIDEWTQYVDAGVKSLEEFANEHDTSLGLFEWSAPDGCDLDDIDAILQANPSIGYGSMTVQTALADRPPAMTDAGYRTEVLCQWVTARADVFMDTEAWGGCADPAVVRDGSVVRAGSALADDVEPVIGVDVSVSSRGNGDWNRKYTYVAVVGARSDGLTHVEVVQKQPGMLWVVDYVKKLSTALATRRVALQIRGCPAGELAEPLRDAGMDVVEINGPALGASVGRLHDRVKARALRHRSQEALDLAVSGAVVKPLGEVLVWNRSESVVDIAPLVAVANALYGFEMTSAEGVTVSAYASDEAGDFENWW